MDFGGVGTSRFGSRVDPRVSAAAFGGTQASPRFSILFVEDDEAVRESLSSLLEQRGYEVDQCVDAYEALEMLETGHIPDLVLLNADTPRPERWDERLRQLHDPKVPRIPVVALVPAGKSQPVAPADESLQRPVKPEVLLDTVRRLLGDLQQERLAARAQEAERLSSLGVVSADIAHEINNPLSFVAGNLELARRYCAQLAQQAEAPLAAALKELDRLLHHAQRGAERVAGVVRGATVFAHAEREQAEPVGVHEVLESTVQLMDNEIGQRAVLERSYEMVPPVKGDPLKLQEALLNLLIHVVQAMAQEPSSGNVIRLMTEEGTAHEALIWVQTRQTTNGHAAASSGPALSLARRILQDMGGRLDVMPIADGVAYRVSLPGQAASVPPPAAVPAPAPAAQARRARVMVIDDEQLMCDLLAAMLGDDYDVVALNNSREALTRLSQGETFDLLLCDLMMPELTGMELHAELVRSRPEQAARMVFMTGGTFTERAYKFLEEPGRVQLQKPFRHEQLLTLVQRRLEELERSAPQRMH
jgi:CheY-like chemotaxis protein